MMIKGYIVDMDGTILDSMFIWDNIVAMLLQKKGITIDNKLKNTLAPLSIDDALKYIKEKYPNVEFHVCGFCEQAYEEKLKEVSNKGVINY